MNKNIIITFALIATLCSCDSWYDYDCDYKEEAEQKEEISIPPTLEAVDLGLSVKWANMNVGATSVVDYGRTVAWGETRNRSYCYWSDYKWGSVFNLTKYCTRSADGKVDYKVTLEAEDDVATALWGSSWRTPTQKEITELKDNCYIVYTNSYNDLGTKGYIFFKAKSESHKGRTYGYDSKYTLSDVHIFLPITSYFKTDDYYWSSSLHEGNNSEAYVLNLPSEITSEGRGDNTYKVRAVRR